VAGETTKTFGDLLTPAGLDEIATYADGIGPWTPYLISSRCIEVVASACVDANGDGRINESDRMLLPASSALGAAKQRGLLVHTWTFRNE